MLAVAIFVVIWDTIYCAALIAVDLFVEIVLKTLLLKLNILRVRSLAVT